MASDMNLGTLQYNQKSPQMWAAIFLGTAVILGLLQFVVPVYWIIVGLIALAILAYLSFRPAMIYYLVLWTLPLTDRVRVLPISFSLNELILLYCVVVWIIQMIISKKRVDFRTGMEGWIVVLSLLFFMAGAFSVSDTGLLGFSKVFESFITFYMTIYFLKTNQITRAGVLRVLLLTALGQAALGVFQSVTSIGSDFQSSRGYLGYLGIGSNMVWHGRGTMWHFNTLGNFLATMYALYLPLYIFCFKQKKKALILGALLLLGIITTYSRGSLLGIAAGTIYFLAVSQKDVRRSILFVAIFVGMVIWPAFSFFGNTPYAETVSYNDRLIIWQVPLAAITLSAKTLWLGSGLNSYADVAWPFIPSWVPQDQFRNWFAHNFYLLTVQEMGLIGAGILFSFLAFLCVDGYRKFRNCHGFERMFGLSLSTGVVTIFFVSIFDHTFGSPHFKVFIFVLLGLLYAKRDFIPKKTKRALKAPTAA
jgi:hypothetical protein